MEQDNNKMILQSIKYTTMRNNFGIYAQRLIVRIAEAMQYRLEDANLYNLEFKPYDPKLCWRFKISDLMQDSGQNYTYVRKELNDLIQSSVYFESDNGKWQKSVIFTDIRGDENTGEIEVWININIWWLFLNMSKGYKKYQLNTALSFKSSYTLRMYQLLVGNEKPITYKIDWLKDLFCVKNNYRNINDFVKYVIETARKELTEKAEITFDYKPEYVIQGKGRPRIDALTFIVKKNDKNMNFETRAKEINRVYGESTIPKEIRIYLMVAYGFTPQGIRANAPLFAEAYMQMKRPPLAEFLRDKRDQAQRAKNPQGWIINAIRGELETI